MSSQDREARLEQRGRLLIDLVRPHLPIEVVTHGPSDAWPLVGPALIARATGTLEAIVALLPLRREADALVLLRSLYEHVVTFAWIAADPGADRFQRFLKSDCLARLRADDDCQEIGISILPADKRREFEATVAKLSKEMPDLLARAEDADKHWEGKIPGLSDPTKPRSFRGFYAFAYRRQSAIAHPSVMGLNPVTVDLPGGAKRVQLEQHNPDIQGPFGMATVVFAFGLYAAAISLGWPRAADVNEVFAKTEVS